MRIRKILPIVVLTTVTLTARGHAGWDVNGVLLSGVSGGYAVEIAPNEDGGAFVRWTSSSYHLYAQRVLADGSLGVGWPVSGITVSVAPYSQIGGATTTDGQGVLLTTWEDYRSTVADIYALRVLPSGSIAPGWVSNGTPVCTVPGYQRTPSIASDGAGGALIAWSDERTGAQTPSVYAQHLLADGSIAPGWVQDGIPVATGPGAHGGTQLISDGSGGAFLAWGDTRNGTADIYAQRLTASGQPASGWVANGNPVCIAPGDQILPVPVPDGGGGFFVAWFDNRTGAPPYAAGDIYCQRMTGDGQIVSGWPATGVPVAATPQVQQAQVMAPDGLGGALIAWEDYRNGISEVFAQRILASGAVAPGWPVNGRPVSTTTYNTLEPRIVGDGQGGVYITYRQMETASDVVPVQHLTASGAVAAGWPSDGFRVVNGSGDQADHDITSDGAGGAIVAFEDGATGKIYAERFAAYGPVPVAVSFENVTATAEEVQLTWQVGIGSLSQTTVERRTESGTWQPLGAALESGNGRLTFTDRQIVPGARYGYRLSWMDSGQLVHGGETWVDVPRAELALEGLRPNPAAADLNVAFSLPSSVPATLELLDVSGRRVVSQEVGSLGAGRHLVQLREGGSVAAGLYWLRLQQGGRSLTARAVVVR